MCLLKTSETFVYLTNVAANPLHLWKNMQMQEKQKSVWLHVSLFYSSSDCKRLNPTEVKHTYTVKIKSWANLKF